MSNNFKLLPNFFLPKNLDMMLDDVLDRKKSFQDYKKVIQIVVNPHFPKGLSHDFRQKFEISSEFNFLRTRPWYDV